MLEYIKKHWPIFVTLLLLSVIVIVVLLTSFKLNDGNFVYAIDDPYIHMAIAKNYTANGNWGPTPYEFASASSSILWTWLIVFIYYIFGVNLITPFILAIISAFILLVISYIILNKIGLPKYLSFIAILLILFITPVTSMIFTGQEHLLHAVITIIAIFLASKLLSKEFEPAKEKRIKIYLLTLAPFITMIRYEGLFLMGILFLIFIFRKKIIFAFLFLSLSLFPVIISGWISISNGGLFMPNSVLAKVANIDLLTLNGLTKFLDYNPILLNPFMYLIFTLIIILVFFKKELWRSNFLGFFILISLLVILAHLEFIRINWFFRYSAYLTPISIIGIAMIYHKYSFNLKNLSYQKNKYIINIIFITTIIFASLLPIIKYKGYVSLNYLPRATQSIYLQQFQMSKFINQYYNNQSLALGDIGTTSYYNNVKLVDLNGLASNNITKLIINNEYDLESINKILYKNNVKLIIWFDSWIIDFFDKIPDNWQYAGSWNNPNNISSASPTVSFYTVNIKAHTMLINNLKDFSTELPLGVIQSGPYTL